MATYEFWYDETRTYKAWLSADSDEQALELINKVQYGQMGVSDLPGFDKTGKNYEILIDTINLERVD
jgi:hypothetical protein